MLFVNNVESCASRRWNEYLGGNLSDVSGLDFVDDLDDDVDLLCSDIGPNKPGCGLKPVLSKVRIKEVNPIHLQYYCQIGKKYKFHDMKTILFNKLFSLFKEYARKL